MQSRKGRPYLRFNLKVSPEIGVYPVFVHQLAAFQKFGESAFASAACVRHLNGDSTDNRPDNIELWFEDRKIDSVGYGDFSEALFTGEGDPTFDLSGYSIGRRPDGSDTNNNIIDFVGLPFASPGAPNGPVVAVIRSRKLVSTWGRIKHDRKE